MGMNEEVNAEHAPTRSKRLVAVWKKSKSHLDPCIVSRVICWNKNLVLIILWWRGSVGG